MIPTSSIYRMMVVPDIINIWECVEIKKSKVKSHLIKNVVSFFDAQFLSFIACDENTFHAWCQHF